MMDTRRLITPWQGWAWYDDLYLVDPNGTRYSPEMIKASAFAMELAHQLTGSPLQVLSLRDELKKRTSVKPPRIVVEWGGKEFHLTHPLFSSAGFS